MIVMGRAGTVGDDGGADLREVGEQGVNAAAESHTVVAIGGQARAGQRERVSQLDLTKPAQHRGELHGPPRSLK